MRFYVGSTFTRYREVRATIDILLDRGHECAHDWTRGEWFNTDTSAGDGYQQMDHWPEMAQREVDAIKYVAEANGFCLFLGQQPSIGWTTEFGMAIAFGVPCISIVAPFKTTVFVALPQVEVFDDVQDALNAIDEYVFEAAFIDPSIGRPA